MNDRPLPEALPAGYRLVRALARFLLDLFYERIEVVGTAAVPAAGGLIVAANHHNSVVDALLLLSVVPRRLRTLANAPLFSHVLIGPFLRMLGALPVHRQKEAGNDPARNAALFGATTETLRSGGAILIFPEGRTQPEPVLLELKTGAARMLLAAEAVAPERPSVTLLPVGLLYEDPGTFREGRALVVIGRPVETADCLGGPEGSAGPVDTLTDRLAAELRGLIVEAGDRGTLRLLRVLEELWQAEGGVVPAEPAARVAFRQDALRLYRGATEAAPARVAAFRADVEAFSSELEAVGLTPSQIPGARGPAAAARFAAREGLALLLGLPLAFAGIVAHVVPYRLTGFIDGRLDRTDEEIATDKLAIGLVLFPLCWVLETLLVSWLAGGWAALAFVAALLPTGFFALAWRERLGRAGREAATLLRFLRDRDLRPRLLARRRALAGELAELSRLSPEVPTA